MERPGSRRVRHRNATAAAETYAPKPNGSTITYGLIAASLLLVLAFLAGGYFGVDVASNGWLLLALAVLAFAGGAVVRFWRQREHSVAVGQEFDKRSRKTSQPAGPGTLDSTAAWSETGEAPAEGPVSVTFTAPFILPGLNQPHPAGSYRVWERREPLDVSWDAFLVTKTIMLTSGATVQALDVTAADLAAALDRDRRTAREQRK